jgi:hypothetical protein
MVIPFPIRPVWVRSTGLRQAVLSERVGANLSVNLKRDVATWVSYETGCVIDIGIGYDQQQIYALSITVLPDYLPGKRLPG